MEEGGGLLCRPQGGGYELIFTFNMFVGLKTARRCWLASATHSNNFVASFVAGSSFVDGG